MAHGYPQVLQYRTILPAFLQILNQPNRTTKTTRNQWSLDLHYHVHPGAQCYLLAGYADQGIRIQGAIDAVPSDSHVTMQFCIPISKVCQWSHTRGGITTLRQCSIDHGDMVEFRKGIK